MLSKIVLLLIFLFNVLNYVDGTMGDTFYVSFNEESFDQGEWIEASKEGLPEMKELTLCHWEWINSFNQRSSNVWSYCVKISEDDDEISCFQYFVQVDPTSHQGGKNFEFFLEFQKGSSLSSVKIKMTDYEERQWNHVCWRANAQGKNQYILNGEIKLEFENKLVVLSSQTRNISSFSIGQEPDSLRGSFNDLQAFQGRIADVNLYNYSLTDEEIGKAVNCEEFKEGNILQWHIDGWIFHETTTKVVKQKEFCQKQEKIFLFPVPMYFNDAKMIWRRLICSGKQKREWKVG